MHHASSSLAYSEPIFHDGGGELKMLDGESVKLRVENATWHGKEREVLKIGEATVIFADAPVANGVVHVLDRVLKMDKLLDRMDEEPAVDPELESYLS